MGDIAKRSTEAGIVFAMLTLMAVGFTIAPLLATSPATLVNKIVPPTPPTAESLAKENAE